MSKTTTDRNVDENAGVFLLYLTRISLVVSFLLLGGCGKPAVFHGVPMGGSVAQIKALYPDLVETKKERSDANKGNQTFSRWPSGGPALQESYGFVDHKLVVMEYFMPMDAYERLKSRFVSEYGTPIGNMTVSSRAVTTWSSSNTKIVLQRDLDSLSRRVRRPDQDPDEIPYHKLTEAPVSVTYAYGG